MLVEVLCAFRGLVYFKRFYVFLDILCVCFYRFCMFLEAVCV